jgi:DNA relaxase NicK
LDRSVKVDFFNFTTKRSVGEVLAQFSSLKNPLFPVDRGLYGYHQSFTSSDGVTVLYSFDRSDVHVQITGSGCSALSLLGLDVVNLLAPGDWCTRLDVAIDCIGSGFTCSEIWGLLQRGDFVSVSSNIRQCEGLLSRKGQFAERIKRGQASSPVVTKTNAGHTIYIGAPSSDRMVRIYDKGAEQETGADWLRFEIQLRRESANQFAGFLSETGDLSTLALRLLNKQVRFFREGQYVFTHDASRLELHPFWAELTDTETPLKLCVPKKIKSVTGTLRYVKNAAKSIKALKLVMDDFDEFFDSLIEDAVLSPAHIAMQDEYKETGYGPDHETPYYHFDALSTLLTGPFKSAI